MTKEQSTLLRLLKIGITGTDALDDNSVIWDEVYRLASLHGVACVVLQAFQTIYNQEGMKPPKQLLRQFFAKSQQMMLTSGNLLHISAEFANILLPIKIAALKGIDYAQYWPNPKWRASCDLDCVAAKGDSHAIDNRAATVGLKVEKGDYKHSHLFYKGMMIENHYHFTSFAGSTEGHILEQNLQRLFLGEFRQIEQTVLLSPNVDFTAVFMIAHAQNHFFYEGISLRHILDWCFFLQNGADTVDWAKVNNVLDRTRLRPFADMFTVVCIEYLGLVHTGYTIRQYPKREVLEMFVNDIFAEQYDDQNRSWNKMVARLLHRYGRMWRFRPLMKMPLHKAIWRTLAFSSFLDRNPNLANFKNDDD